eukprot:7683232-Alexandrium_andersonii.AAC.1
MEHEPERLSARARDAHGDVHTSAVARDAQPAVGAPLPSLLGLGLSSRRASVASSRASCAL